MCTGARAAVIATVQLTAAHGHSLESSADRHVSTSRSHSGVPRCAPVLNTTENPPVPFEFVTELRDVEQNLLQPVFVSAFLAVRRFHLPPPPHGDLRQVASAFDPSFVLGRGSHIHQVHGTDQPATCGGIYISATV